MRLPLTSRCWWVRRDDRVLSSKIALTGGGLARTSGVEDDVRRAMCGGCGGEGGGGGGGGE